MSGKSRIEDCKPGEDGSQRRSAEERFTRDLVERGEAAPANEAGELPEGATHEITKQVTGETHVKRRRFSAF